MEEKSCAICSRQKDTKQETATTIFEDDLWLVRHSAETNILGYLVVESKRHFLDMSLSSDVECQSLGYVLREVNKALHRVLHPERIYTYTLAEAVPHFHIHVIPRTDAMPRHYRGRGIMSYPIKPFANKSLVDEISARLKTQVRHNLTMKQRNLTRV
jgi:diadenosine tetraphosphate (Ap4A) HIT family hydrolase